MARSSSRRAELTGADRDFLSRYDPGAYPRPSVAVDVCVLTVVDGEIAVVLVRRGEPPFAGMPALPGAFVGMDESLEDAARRALSVKAGLGDIYLEQLYTFGAPDRDPRTRVISVTYVALVPKDRLQLGPGLDPAPYGLARALPAPEGGDRLVDQAGRDVALAFDHGEVVRVALERIRGKLTYTTIAFQLVPERFTLTELQHTYEVILGRSLSKPAFRRKILEADVVEETGDMRRGGHRPAKLYRFVRDEAGGEL